MEELIVIEEVDYLNELTVENDGGYSLKISIENPDSFTQIDLNTQQVKDLIKVLQAWVIR